MISRIVFDAEFAHAVRIRGLTCTELARRSRLALATVSAALDGRPVNVGTALRLSRAVSGCPVVPELETWARSPRARGAAPTGVPPYSDRLQSDSVQSSAAPHRRARHRRAGAVEDQLRIAF
jgi:hypothetical protein